MSHAFWQDIYLGAQKTSIAGTAKTFLSTDIGPDLGHCALPVTNNPDFALKKKHRVLLRQSGTFTPYADVTSIQHAPSVTLNFELDVKTLGFFLYLFFQKGTSQTVDNSHFNVVYDDSTCEVWATLARLLSRSSAQSQRLDGAICRQITISGKEGEALKCTVEMIGRELTNDFDWDAQSSVAQFPEDEVLLFKNLQLVEANIALGNITTLTDFTLRLSNNAVSNYYDDSELYEFRLGRITGTFDFSIPYELRLKTAGTQVALFNLTAYNSKAQAVFWVNINCIPTVVTELGNNLIVSTHNMQIHDSSTSTVSGIEMYIQDRVDRGITRK